MKRDDLCSSPSPEKMLATYGQSDTGQAHRPRPRFVRPESPTPEPGTKPRVGLIGLMVAVAIIGVAASVVFSALDEIDDESDTPEVEVPQTAASPTAPPATDVTDDADPSLSDVEAAGDVCFSDFEAQSPGDNASCDFLHRECAAGNLAACDELWTTSNVGSEYERFASTCGDRSTDARAGFCLDG